MGEDETYGAVKGEEFFFVFHDEVVCIVVRVGFSFGVFGFFLFVTGEVAVVDCLGGSFCVLEMFVVFFL